MAEEGRLAKSVFFRMPAWMLFLLVGGAIALAIFLAARLITVNISGAAVYPLIGLFIILMSLNGNSIMQDGGIDIIAMLHFGITVVFGITAGFLATILSTILSLYLAGISTPVDFFIQKNTMKIWIHASQLVFSTIFLWGVTFFFGTGIISAKLVLIYMLSFTAGRLVKSFLLITVQQVPISKVLGTMVIFYFVNYYEVLFIGAPFLAFLHSL